MSATETIFIENVHDLVQALLGWHQHKVSILQHMLEIPPGTEMELNEGETLKLEGEVLKAFQAGINVALSELGTLPFEFDVENPNGSKPISN